jgi:hypothetical protein
MAVAHQNRHTEVDRFDPKTELTRPVCPNYKSIPCSVHVETIGEAMPIFRPAGTPTTYVCDSQGKVIGTVSGLKPKSYVRALQQAQTRIGKKPTLASTLVAWDEGFVTGDKGFRTGDFQAALKGYRGVEEHEKAPNFLRRRATRRIEKLTEAALEAIMQAEFLDEGKVRPALNRLVKAVKGLPEAEEAVKEALADLED